MFDVECWLPVPGYEGLYEVSDRGRVYSIPFHGKGAGNYRVGGILKPCHSGGRNKYQRVTLSRNSTTEQVYVHRLVASTFIGPCPEGLEVLHLDDNGDNNYVDNLTYGTRSENMQMATWTKKSSGWHWTPEAKAAQSIRMKDFYSRRAA